MSTDDNSDNGYNCNTNATDGILLLVFVLLQATAKNGSKKRENKIPERRQTQKGKTTRHNGTPISSVSLSLSLKETTDLENKKIK
jgi:hypothetical protein